MFPGLEQFLSVFGNITVGTVVIFIIAIIFLILVYKKVKKYFVDRYKAEKGRDEKINEALEEVRKYPQYREKSRQIQNELWNEINELKTSQTVLVETQTEMNNTLNEMIEKQERRERNKLRDKLLQSYRYYTDIEKNPSQSWTKMESEAFWELFGDYEDMNGDGYIHSVVQPAMNSLKIVEN